MRKIVATLILLYSFQSLAQTKETTPPPTMGKDAEVPIAKVEEKKDNFNLTSYQPIYFLYHPNNAKVQASFKYKLHRKMNFYAAYTHLILWNLQGDSKPFNDVNYNPELFYRWEFKNTSHIESIDFLPYGHTSNGKDSIESRSLNYVASQINFKFDLKKNMVLRSSLRLRYLYDFDPTNEDIRDYYGPVEFKIAVTEFTKGFIDKGEISAKVYTGGAYGEDFSKGGQEIGLTFRIMGVDITPAFYLQYFHGYNESLKYYNQEESVFRFGLVL